MYYYWKNVSTLSSALSPSFREDFGFWFVVLSTFEYHVERSLVFLLPWFDEVPNTLNDILIIKFGWKSLAQLEVECFWDFYLFPNTQYFLRTGLERAAKGLILKHKWLLLFLISAWPGGIWWMIPTLDDTHDQGAVWIWERVQFAFLFPGMYFVLFLPTWV